MNNLIFEMKKITDDAKKEGLSKNQIFVRLKEFLHYFVLDFIYNSEFKGMVFYGGSCLRIIYDLPILFVGFFYSSTTGSAAFTAGVAASAPAFLISAMISLKTFTFSFKNFLAPSNPWPIFSPL